MPVENRDPVLLAIADWLHLGRPQYDVSLLYDALAAQHTAGHGAALREYRRWKRWMDYAPKRYEAWQSRVRAMRESRSE